MSTSSYIGLKTGKNVGEFVYCHWDGYPEHTGKILRSFYDNEGRVRALLNMGAISSIEPKIDPDPNKPHDFMNRQEGVSTFYTRDRGDDFREAEEFELDSNGDFDSVDYAYMFDPEENRWYIYGASEWDPWVPLDDII